MEAESSGTPLGAVALGLGGGVPASAVDLGAIAALQAGLPAEAGALARHLAPPGADAQAQDALAARIAGRLATHLDAWRALGVL
jgi:hypothetical protein